MTLVVKRLWTVHSIFPLKSWLNSSGSSDDIFSVNFISKFNLPVLQKNSLWEDKQNKNRVLYNIQLNSGDTVWRYVRHLLSSPNDEDPTEDKALSQNVSHEAILEGPQAIHPHPDTQEREETHLPLTGPIKAPLQCKQTN